MKTLTLSSGEIYRVEGPAKINVVEGELYAVGIVFKPGSTITVLRARKTVLKPVTDRVVINVTLGPGAYIEVAKPEEEVVDEWEAALGKLDLRGAIIVVGAVDVGKSTLSAILANKSVQLGRKTFVIDADIGQNDLGPPATVSMCEVRGIVTHLRQLSAEVSVFVNATSAERVWQKVVDAVPKLVRYAVSRGGETVIINTDGWVVGEEAAKYKAELIRRVSPSYVIGIEREDELKLIMSLVPEYSDRFIIVRPPAALRIRGFEDRRIHREMGYGRYLQPAKEISLTWPQVRFRNLPLFEGVELGRDVIRMIERASGVRIIYANQVGDRVYAVVDDGEWGVRHLPNAMLYMLPSGFEQGLLVGLEDGDGILVGLGMLKKIYYSKKKIVVIASEAVERRIRDVRYINVGYLRLNENFEEVEKVYRIARYEL